MNDYDETTYRKLWVAALEKAGGFSRLSKPQLESIAAQCRHEARALYAKERES